jgi:hypothetical protein
MRLGYRNLLSYANRGLLGCEADVSHPNSRKYDLYMHSDRLCGLLLRVLGYRSRGLGSIPGATIFSEKYWVWNGVH